MHFDFTTYRENGEFVRAAPFSASLPLSSKAFSDHSSIMTRIDGVVVGSINLNNIWYCTNFNSARKESEKDVIKGSGPFKETHLYRKSLKESSPDELAQTNTYMNLKHATQLTELFENFINKKMDLLFLDECYPLFYQQLQSKFQDLIDQGKVKIICSWDSLGEEAKKKENNLSAMLINTLQVEILQTSFTALNSDHKVTLLPTAKLKQRSSEKEIVAIATHVPGNAEQFPEKGLASLCFLVNDQVNQNPGAIIMMAGDCNTVPSNVNKVFQSHLSQGTAFKVIPPDYFTHINPFGYAAKYDMTLVAFPEDKSVEIEVLGKKALPESCQALIEGIEQAVDAAAKTNK